MPNVQESANNFLLQKKDIRSPKFDGLGACGPQTAHNQNAKGVCEVINIRTKDNTNSEKGHGTSWSIAFLLKKGAPYWTYLGKGYLKVWTL